MNSDSFDDFIFTHNSKMILGQYFLHVHFSEVVLQSFMLSTFPFKITMLTLMCNFRSFTIYKNTRHHFIKKIKEVKIFNVNVYLIQ